MSVVGHLALGAPGVYVIPDEPLRVLTGIRMDVCAFVGVAPRGPARVPRFNATWAPQLCREGQTVTHSVPVAVESWEAYRRLYGAFEGPSLLPYAVASFFENGGVRAYIVRIVHEYVTPDGSPDDAANARGVASARLVGLAATDASGGKAVWLRARNEGDWGNRLHATLSFRARPLGLAPTAFTTSGVGLPLGTDITAGSVLRLDVGRGARVLVRVATVREEWHPTTGAREWRAEFDTPALLAVQSAEVVEGMLEIDDGDGRTERHERLGLSSTHPRWLGSVLVNESELVYPGEDPTVPPGDPKRTWFDDDDLIVDPSLPTRATAPFAAGENRYRDIVPGDFVDFSWVPGDECPGKGVHALVDLSDLSLVVAPDLYSPRPLVPVEAIVDVAGAGADFEACVEASIQSQEPQPEDLDGLRLDPNADLETIVFWQRQLVDLATRLESFIVLLDVPPGLSQRRILGWRARWDSAYAAAYHSWLEVSRVDDRRNTLIRVNPAAVAAGIIARRELAAGVQEGPANVLAAGVLNVADPVSAARHDELHPNAVNVYLLERDGVRLTAARTLALDRPYRQLSVRRLITMLRRVLEREMQWAVFEPNNAQLRGDVVSLLEAYLHQLFLANAFAGAREAEAFFVRCDDQLNPPPFTDQGKLLALVGVAPAEPLEFIVLQIARDGDGTLRVTG
jgi:hypothetical protein